MSQRDWFAAVILISSAGIFSGNSFRAKSTGPPGCIIAALKGGKSLNFQKVSDFSGSGGDWLELLICFLRLNLD